MFGKKSLSVEEALFQKTTQVCSMTGEHSAEELSVGCLTIVWRINTQKNPQKHNSDQFYEDWIFLCFWIERARSRLCVCKKYLCSLHMGARKRGP